MEGGKRLDELLRAAASRWPDRLAIESGGDELTYRELDVAADRIAATLQDQGVRPGDRVGIHLPKSIEAVVSLYGVMRAGAAYVPLDSAAPPARTAYIAADCGLSALISDQPLIDALRRADPAVVQKGIVRDATASDGFLSWEATQRATGDVQPRQLIDVDLAYVLYTSGSTGEPKGVSISHRNSLTFVNWALATFGFQEADVLSSHAPLHFDLSILDLFGAAIAGARVCLVPADAAMFPTRLCEWIREREITVWYSVPSALAMMVRYGDVASKPLSSLRFVLFAGEVFPNRHLRELMRVVPGARFFNLYGPTETNVCTYHEVLEAPPVDGPSVPIGQPCANTRCEVLDDAGAPVDEVGAEGELVVTGSIVAQGYWGDSGRTAERFTAPYTYRTGDVVNIIGDSPVPEYRFVGRRDHLVKSRGYRIELGEIEAALHAHPAVAECVAVAVPDDLIGNRIAAFCTLEGSVDERDLELTCRQRVPAYMVPERIILRDSLPRTPNDKYDRPELTRQASRTIAAEGEG